MNPVAAKVVDAICNSPCKDSFASQGGIEAKGSRDEGGDGTSRASRIGDVEIATRIIAASSSVIGNEDEEEEEGLEERGEEEVACWRRCAVQASSSNSVGSRLSLFTKSEYWL